MGPEHLPHMKKYSLSLVIRAIHIRIARRYHLSSVRQTHIQHIPEMEIAVIGKALIQGVWGGVDRFVFSSSLYIKLNGDKSACLALNLPRFIPRIPDGNLNLPELLSEYRVRLNPEYFGCGLNQK